MTTKSLHRRSRVKVIYRDLKELEAHTWSVDHDQSCVRLASAEGHWYDLTDPKVTFLPRSRANPTPTAMVEYAACLSMSGRPATSVPGKLYGIHERR